MAQTRKRTTKRVPSVITKLLKAVSDLSTEEASAALQEACEDETSIDNRVTLMKARIKLLQDAQKPKRAPRTAKKKPEPKPKTAETPAEKPKKAEEKPEKPAGTITSLDLNSLGALFGAAPDGDEPAAEEPTAEDAAPTAATPQFDLSALDALGGDEAAEDKPAFDLSALDMLGDDDDAAAAPEQEAVIATPAPAAEPEPEPEPEPDPIPPYEEIKVAKSTFPKDETYCEVWAEMITDTIKGLADVRVGDEAFDTRRNMAEKLADQLGYAAQQMGYGDWANLMGAFQHKCPYLTKDWVLDTELNALVAEMAELNGTPAPDMPAMVKTAPPAPAAAEAPTEAENTSTPDATPETTPEATPEAAEKPQDATPAEGPAPQEAAEATPTPDSPAEPAPDADAVADPAAEPPKAAPAMPDMSALFAEMGDSDSSSSNDDDIWEFDEDLSEEELAAKNAAKNADLQESDSERPVGHGAVADNPAFRAEAGSDTPAPTPAPAPEPSELAVEIDETPLTSLAEDEKYIEIWNEMIGEAFDQLRAVRASSDGFEARQKQADAAADRLGYAAGQLGFAKWGQVLEDFAFDCPALEDDAALNAALDKLLEDLAHLNGGAPDPKPGAEPTPAPAAAKPASVAEPAAETTPDTTAKTTPAEKPDTSDMDALFAEMGDSASNNDDDVWDFDEDLSEEELAAKKAAQAGDLEESAAERPVDHSAKPSELAVEIDETPLNSLAEDDKYIEIWNEMIGETLDALGVIRRSDDAFEDRQKRADAAVDRLGYAATQLGFEGWMQVCEDFIFDCPALEDDTALNTALDQLIKDLEGLNGGPATPPATSPAQALAAAPAPQADTAPDPASQAAPATPEGGSMDALFAEMGDSTSSNDDDVWEFDEDLSEEELAAKKAAQAGALEESAAERPVDHSATLSPLAVDIDETPIASFAEDDTYMEVWADMVGETLAALGVIRRSDDALADRIKRADANADRLGYAAAQMGFAKWSSVLEDFTFDCPNHDSDAALNAALDQLIADLEHLQGGKAPAKAATPPAPAAPEPVATAPAPAPVAPAPATSAGQPKGEPAPAAKDRKAEAPAGALLRERKATLDDLYKFFPK